MVKVYEIVPDERFQYLTFTEDDAASNPLLEFTGLPVEEEWKPPKVAARERRRKKPDIWHMVRTFAFEPHAARILDTCLYSSGERLPLPFEGRELTVLNVTYVLECLDTKKSVFNRKSPNKIDKFVFHKRRMDESLFMIPQTCMASTIYTVEGLASPEQEFKPRVEEHKFQGLRFVEVWSDE